MKTFILGLALLSLGYATVQAQPAPLVGTTITAQQAASNSAGAGQVFVGPGGASAQWALRQAVTNNVLNVDYWNGSAWTAGLLSVSNGGVLTLATNNVTHMIGATGTGAVFAKFFNTTGTTYTGVDSSTGASFSVGNYASLIGTDSTAGMSIFASAAAAIRFYTNNTASVPILRWGINSAGDWTGTSSRLVDSVGTPTCGSNCIAFVGTPLDYSFTYLASGTPHAASTVNFGHTWSAAPNCTVSANTGGTIFYVSAVSTTAVTISNAAGTAASYNAAVLCRGT